MTATMTSTDWLDAMDRHYLSDYIAAGGSAVKFAVCYPDVDHVRLANDLRERAKSRFVVAHVDAANTRINKVEELFGRIADQVPWNLLVENVLAEFARINHWDTPVAFGPSGVVQQLAELNRLAEQAISVELQRQIATGVLIDRKMSKDFRFAMHWLARARLGGPERDVIFQEVTDWLGGRVRAISQMRRYQIFAKIHRTNARHLFASMLAWIRRAGGNGLVVTVDGGRLLATDRVTDGSANYTSAARDDVYQLLREFIDGADALDACLLLVLMPQDFLDLEPRGRGLGRNSALLSRVYDEVRARELVNPLTALARVNDPPSVSSGVHHENRAIVQ